MTELDHIEALLIEAKRRTERLYHMYIASASGTEVPTLRDYYTANATDRLEAVATIQLAIDTLRRSKEMARWIKPSPSPVSSPASRGRK